MSVITADLEYFPAINFAMQQSLLSYIQKITIKNLTNSRIDNVWFTLSFEPQFAENISIRVGSVMPGQTVEINSEHFDIKLSFDFLVGLTERIKGYNVIDLYSGNTLIYHEKYDVVLLALEECPLRIASESIAAFVTPNHPILTGILRRASEILDILEGSPSLGGYPQYDPEDSEERISAMLSVENQIHAVYTALKELEVTYILPPQHFFRAVGQRVRMADDVVARRLGTCLDTSILFASCLEAIGLNPLIILTHNHAFAGCFLKNIISTRDLDAEDLQDLCNKNAIEFIETTAITKGKSIGFDRAVELANRIVFEDEDSFECALDIKKIREELCIQPLPQRVLQEYWDNSNQLLTLPQTQPEALPDNREISVYNDDLYYIYLNEIVYGPYRLDQMVDLPLLPDTMVTTNRLNGEWYEARNFGCFAHKFTM